MERISPGAGKLEKKKSQPKKTEFKPTYNYAPGIRNRIPGPNYPSLEELLAESRKEEARIREIRSGIAGGGRAG